MFNSGWLCSRKRRTHCNLWEPSRSTCIIDKFFVRGSWWMQRTFLCRICKYDGGKVVAVSDFSVLIASKIEETLCGFKWGKNQNSPAPGRLKACKTRTSSGKSRLLHVFDAILLGGKKGKGKVKSSMPDNLRVIDVLSISLVTRKRYPAECFSGQIWRT